MTIYVEDVQRKIDTTSVKIISRKNEFILIHECELRNKSWLLELDDSIDFLVVAKVSDIEETKLFLERNIFKVRKPYTELLVEVKLPNNIILIKK